MLVLKENRISFIQAAIVLVIILAEIFLFRKVLMNAYIPSESMEPTFTEGMRLIATREDKVGRGDVIIFRFPGDPSVHYIKRVIGLPRDTVEIKEDGVYVNGETLEEPYLKERMKVQDEQIFVVPEDSYFLMGDNRNNSYDSRAWKEPYVDKKYVEGHPRLVYWPLSKAGAI